MDNELNVTIPNDIRRMLNGLKPIIEKIMSESEFTENDISLFALRRGLEALLDDLVGDSPELLTMSFTNMLYDNPEYLGKMLAQTIDDVDNMDNQSTDIDTLAEEWKKKRLYM
ncbi:MAG: hypothetical protein ACXACU_09355 [Candidatus Hodarchaeales archaeon]|jgi:hypothetical protein